MNQIIYVEEKDNTNINRDNTSAMKNKKTVSFNVFIPIAAVISVLVISTSFYASGNNGELLAYSDNANNINAIDNTINDNILIAEITDEENIIIEDEIDDDQEENNSSNSPVTVSTTINGRNYDSIGILNIPSLGIEYPVLSSTSTELLKISLNKYWGPNPNEVGNLVIVGHNYKNGTMFGKLSQIKIGSIVKITDLTGKTLDYKVYETDIIDPYDNSCTSQLTDGNIEITLITCCNSGKQRFIVKARAN